MASQNTIMYENIRLKPAQKIGLRYYDLKDNTVVDFESHFHMMPEIMKFRGAEGHFIINQKTYPLTPNTLVYVPSMAVHQMYLTEKDKDFYLLQFEQVVFTDLNVEMFNSLGNRPLVIELNKEDNERIDSLLNWGHAITDDLSQQTIRDTLVKTVLLYVYGKIQELEIPEEVLEQNKTMARMFPLLKYLEEEQKFSISLDEASSMCGLSRFHFSRLFKSFFKTYFKDYLLKRKISAAVTLLTGSNFNISEIAYKCEFSDTAYFSQKFKEVLGKTPSEFRKSLMKTDQFIESKDA
ncbi:MAG: AraC family transcriptional regulator [Reichenbachiella sp.]